MEGIFEKDLLKPYVFKAIKMPRHVSYNNSYWLDNKKYFFKYSPVVLRDTGMIVGEIYVSLLCKKLGVDCVQCRYAINKHKNYEHRGVVVKNFLKKGEQSITLRQIRDKIALEKASKDLLFQINIVYARMAPICMFFMNTDLNTMVGELLDDNNPKLKRLLPIDKAFLKDNRKDLEIIYENTKKQIDISVKQYVELIEDYAKSKGFKLVGNTKLELQKMAIIDAVTKQYDRHDGNISLIYDEKKKEIRIAPMYDNGLCGNFAVNAPIVAYPKVVNAYLKLTEEDFKEISNSKTEIGRFYTKVKNFYNNGLDKLLEDLQIEGRNSDSQKISKKSKENSLLIEREKDKFYWKAAKTYYDEGIRYIDNNLNKLTEEKEDKRVI